MTANKLALKVGVGTIGSSGTPLNVTVASVAAQAPDGVYLNKTTGNLTIGGVSLLGITGISTTNGDAPIQVTAGGNLVISEKCRRQRRRCNHAGNRQRHGTHDQPGCQRRHVRRRYSFD